MTKYRIRPCLSNANYSLSDNECPLWILEEFVPEKTVYFFFKKKNCWDWMKYWSGKTYPKATDILEEAKKYILATREKTVNKAAWLAQDVIEFEL